MLMKTRIEPVDFFFVETRHKAIHKRLENWKHCISVRGGFARVHPMWAPGRSNGRQWEMPVIKEPVDTLDAMKMEKAVGALPIKNRDAIRWNYVHCYSPIRACRELAVSHQGLLDLIHDGRQMLINRRV